MRKDNQNRPIPTPGARPYEDDLEEYFFGREQEIQTISNYISSQRFSVLAAESASGKTSLLQAGLVPILRKKRLNKPESNISDLPPFPLLLNQWLGRAGDERGTDFLRILVVEIDRYLSKCEIWFVKESKGKSDHSKSATIELERVRSALKELRNVASKRFLAKQEKGEGPLKALPLKKDKIFDDNGMTEDLQYILNALTDTLGPIIIILDQFEEVLDDPLLAKQAQVSVESIFQLRKDIKQFLSLRSDAIHLLTPIEILGIFEGKRRVKMSRFTPKDAKEIFLRTRQQG